ncbi:MAG: GNAT family N-acetyltransferase [Gemmatimonadales bacterium]
MRLLPLEPATIPLAASWLASKENYQWLDFGRDLQILTAPLLTAMSKRERLHLLRLYTPDEGDPPIGLVALSDISAIHKTAVLWYVLGDKRFGGRSYTTRAVAELLALGFGQLDLRAVHAWAVEANAPSLAVLEHNGFTPVGRLQQCHEIDGRAHDRLLFELLRCAAGPQATGTARRTP